MDARSVRKLSGCDNGTCPAVYLSDRGTTVVQGDLLAEADGLVLGPGEAAVELPSRIVLEAVLALTVDADPAVTRQLKEMLACS